MAAQEGHLECIRTLLEAKADVQQRRNDYATALHGAVRNKQHEAARVLLEAGADVEERSETYDTTLLLAVFSGHMPSVRLLLAYKADVEAENSQGEFPFSVAVHNGDLACIDVLATSKANISRAVAASGMTGLHVAVLRNSSDVLCELLELRYVLACVFACVSWVR